MILQAVPYYQRRFESNTWILRYFQSFNLIVFSFTILATTLILAKSKADAPYEGRLRKALLGYVLVASLLTASTVGPFIGRPEVYFIFLLLMVFITAAANGLSQNAAFAFAAGFGRTEYAPAIMMGEALAGLLPSTVGKLSRSQISIFSNDVQKFYRLCCSPPHISTPIRTGNTKHRS